MLIEVISPSPAYCLDNQQLTVLTSTCNKINVILSLSLSLLLVATASLEQAAYSVSEDEGYVMICVELTDGVLERMITVYLNTASGTAIGKNFIDSINGY